MIITAGRDKFFSRDNPMLQPDTVNQLPDRAQLLKPKFDGVEKLLEILMVLKNCL